LVYNSRLTKLLLTFPIIHLPLNKKGHLCQTQASFSLEVGSAGFKSEGEYLPPIAIPCAPAHGSGHGGIGSLFALNPDVKDGWANLPEGGG